MKWFIFAVFFIIILLSSALAILGTKPLDKTGFGITLTADKADYTMEEPVVAGLKVVNRTASAVTLKFNTAQRYDFIIEDEKGVEIWRWSKDRMFAQMLGEEVVEPGKELIYHETYKGNLESGNYKLSGVVTAENRPLAASIFIVVE